MPGTTNVVRSLSLARSSKAISPPSSRIFDPSPSSASTRLFATANGDKTFNEQCDVLVLGSGPAARSIASLLSVKNDVVLADQRADVRWVPNYGVWDDEWQTVVDRYKSQGVKIGGGSCGRCVDREWKVTDCYFGGSFDIPFDKRMRLDRPYCRVARESLQKALTTDYGIIKANHFSEAIGVNLYSPAGSLVHDKNGTTIQLKTDDDKTVTFHAKLVVDCTGHESKIVLKDTRDPYRPPGFQIAYGVFCEVDESESPDLTHVGPYDKEAMTLFDYRTDHFDDDSKAVSAPTFMYAMPLEDNRIFFEETSLVARPAVSFQECKDRFEKRMKFHGIKVTKVEEEEFCYIPMGGALPVKDQRVLALGGSAAMVHPSTGYHLCRCMMGAADLAVAVQQELDKKEDANLDRAAAAAYHALWRPSNIRQRNFAVFGGEYLMKQDVVGLRGFFDGFFRLPMELWGGFLAGWPGLPNNDKHETWLARMWYGVSFLARLPPVVALNMLKEIVLYIVQEGVPLAQSVTPFLGEPESYEYARNLDHVGDVAAKVEARRMIAESSVSDDMPVDFDVAATDKTAENVLS